MEKIIEVKGSRFGRLTALRKAYNPNVNTGNHRYWECLCECGDTNLVLEANLVSGKVKSCGCMLGLKKGTKWLGDYPNLVIEEGVFLEGGLFLVFENGQIFRSNGKSMVEAPKFSVGRNQYKTVTGAVGGKQKHFYVHRLLASAFIPNPDNKPQINHIDGNPENNHLSNLEWVTASENIQHAYDIGLTENLSNTDRRCGLCKEPSMAVGACQRCKQSMQLTKSGLKRKREIKESVQHIDLSVLTEKQREYMRLRMKGLGFDEIGELTNTSRQNAEISIKSSITRFHKNKDLCKRLGINTLRSVTKGDVQRIKYLRKKISEFEKELRELIA